MTTPPLSIEAVIKMHFAPLLRAEGFRGSGRTFRRTRGRQIHVLHIQGARYGGQFAINLGIQPATIPDAGGKAPDHRKIGHAGCEFRRRLSEPDADQWWAYDDAASLEAAMRAASRTYETCGRPLFDAMAAAPSPLDTISLAQLIDGPTRLQGFGNSEGRMALAFARMREADGRIDEAVAFACHALDCASQAFGLRPELERIKALQQPPAR